MAATRTNRFLLATSALQLFSSLSQAADPGAYCRTADDFNIYNATKSYAMPALQINRTEEQDEGFDGIVGGLIPDSEKTWYIVSRVASVSRSNLEGAIPLLWLNTADSNTTDIGVCTETTSPYGLNEYEFSREVLERSVNDNGDCRTMLGSECVDALARHYQQQAFSSSTSGDCPSGSNVNLTVPYQCANLINGADGWNGGVMYTSMNISSTYTEKDLNASFCGNETKPLNASIHGGGGIGGEYNQTIRFPQPHFITFWPNRTGVSSVSTSWIEDVHVEIRCLRPDDISEGSLVPPSAQELLDRADVQYNKNATSPNSSPSPSQSTGGAGAMKTAAPYLGAAGIAALLLV